ncbi:glycosyl transferase, family 2 [Methanospirillum hungatei JF-1]|uniref:Glycosyl transferase, family 2 n=1 Tax=Methanospirillum hungatei JF-1 (strain ATCC 27890 / DSM 864 / NBRC 100397 / JF-1) TaxID=323259 RepID=Q2FUJ8_METHJ|nr:glycosyltransferase family 2 protein [Methanospirillum hungatei]ABD42807.1 glycosyl transferase, family 2 [Methanospirillum hungatei JF-1]
MENNDDCIQYSIVIPVYNSEKSLEELVNRILSSMFLITEQFEIILIDDCSYDDSWNLLKKLHQTTNKLKIIHLLKNFGQHNALLCGFSYAKGEYIIVMDDDLQNSPEDIPILIDKIWEGYSVVFGKYKVKYHSSIENFFSRRYQGFIHHILDIPTDIFISSFVILKRDVVKNMISIKSSYIFLPALMQKSVPTRKITNVEVTHNPRKYGKSNYNIRKYLSLSLNLIINYSTLPLVMIGLFGIFISLFSLGYGLSIIGRYIIDPSYGVMGWNSLMVALSFLGGTILFSIAIIGEYLRRILMEVSYGQQYVIDEIEL